MLKFIFIVAIALSLNPCSKTDVVLPTSDTQETTPTQNNECLYITSGAAYAGNGVVHDVWRNDLRKYFY